MPEEITVKELKQSVEQLVGEVRKTTTELEAKVKSGEGGQSELQTKIDNLNTAIDKQEKSNQDLVLKMAESAKKEAEAKERLDELEEKLIKAGSSNGSIKEQKEIQFEKEMKAFDEWSKAKEFSAETKDYLRTDNNVDGGFLMRESYDNMIIKPITEVSPIRQIARTKRVDAIAENMALRSSLVQSFWTGEGEDFIIGNSQYARPRVPVHSLTTKTEITNKALLASPFNMDNEILSDFRESREQAEGQGFVLGNGVDKPRGFLDTSLQQASTGTDSQKIRVIDGSGSSTFDFDDLILLTGEQKAGYNNTYGMNRKTLAFARTLQDGAGRYIWASGNLGAGIPNQINGEPYVIIPDMPDIATNATPIVYADWTKFYTIVDAWTAIMLRNQWKKDGFVVFTMESFMGGDVTLGEAGVLLKTVA